jgi:hypothetical protein
VGHVPMPGSAMRAARISRSAAVPSCGVLSIVEQQEEAQLPYIKLTGNLDPENLFGSMFGQNSREFHVSYLLNRPLIRGWLPGSMLTRLLGRHCDSSS